MRNRRAWHDYELLERFEAGLALVGSEVKAIRAGRISIAEAYAKPHHGELYIYDMHIATYDPASGRNHDPLRPRKLLLHRFQIARLSSKVEQKGLTIVPLRVYTNKRGIVKIEIALARGKATHDRRDEIRKRDLEREIRRGGRL